MKNSVTPPVIRTWQCWGYSHTQGYAYCTSPYTRKSYATAYGPLVPDGRLDGRSEILEE